MTNINGIRKRKAEKEKKAEKESLDMTTLLYQKQKKAIQEISQLPGYKAIKDFWILQEKQATYDLKNIRFSDMQEFGRVQAKSNMSDKFISFLSELEK